MDGAIADRVLADMRAGRRVMVLEKDQRAARTTFEQVAARLNLDEKAWRGLGRERCAGPGAGGGQILFLSVWSCVRGLAMDTVVFNGYEPTERQLVEVMPTLACSPHAEVIRA